MNHTFYAPITMEQLENVGKDGFKLDIEETPYGKGIRLYEHSNDAVSASIDNCVVRVDVANKPKEIEYKGSDDFIENLQKKCAKNKINIIEGYNQNYDESKIIVLNDTCIKKISIYENE